MTILDQPAAVGPRDRYTAITGRVQLTGVQALARLPIEQHRRDLDAGRHVGTFVSGYEGSPLAGYDLELGRQRALLEANDVVFVPGLNEESAATAVQGSQLATTFDGATRDGVVGLWYGKAPGLDRATDAIRHGNLMGAHPSGGAVLLVGDDPAAKSSSVPCSSQMALMDLAVPFLEPADSQDVIELGLHAIELSRVSGLWTGLRIVTAVADGSSTVTLGHERGLPVVPHGAKRHVPSGRLLQPTLGLLERDLVTTRLRLAREYSAANRLNRVVGRGRSDVLGVVAGGRTWQDLLAALERLGVDESSLEASGLRLLRVGMPWPLDDGTIRDFAKGLDEILVLEEKRPFLESALRDILYGLPDAPLVTGKRGPAGLDLVPAHGELDVEVIAPRLRRRLLAHGLPAGADPDRSASVPAGRTTLGLAPVTPRAPSFCSGCPHSSSTATPADTLVGGGIGCHAMVLLMDESQVGTVTGLSQMGGEGLQWIGMAPFLDREHFVQNLGDGTFDHSGSLAVRAAVAAGVNITYRLLYNSAVAMTGGQQAVGAMTVDRVVRVLLAEGVARVLVTTEDLGRYPRRRLPAGVEVWDRSRMDEAMELLTATPGVTVLVHDQECATEKRRKRTRGRLAAPATRVFINERICEGCGDCGRKSACMSVQPVPTEHGRKTRIHQASCNVDDRCLEGDCPAFMTVEVDAEDSRSRGAAPGVAALGPDDVPEPTLVVGHDECGVRFAGIGGTGVVTVSQVLATAGLLAGWTVRSLDQTGLAQKGGAVVSDVRLTRGGPGTSSKLASGDCDLYVGCDLLVAADPVHLAAASSSRTVGVLSTTQVPTGLMVADASVEFPPVADTARQVTDRLRRGAVVLDARRVAAGLFGDDQLANVLLLGVGYQQGGLPVPAAAVEEAIRLNGVAVEANLQAFRRGRQYVVDAAAVERLADRGDGAPADPMAAVQGESELDRLVRTRHAELRAYQDRAYADRYAGLVAEVSRREQDRVPGAGALAESVARHLFKLMAYKDEYEVARLALDPQVAADLRRELGPGSRASWNLHPPVLRALGVQRKLRLGPWFAPAFHVLRGMRRLRGTRLDPFGRAHVRVVERQLVEEYVKVVHELVADLAPDTHGRAVEIAGLPDMVRGYEDVKLTSVRAYRQRLAELRGKPSTDLS